MILVKFQQKYQRPRFAPDHDPPACRSPDLARTPLLHRSRAARPGTRPKRDRAVARHRKRLHLGHLLHPHGQSFFSRHTRKQKQDRSLGRRVARTRSVSDRLRMTTKPFRSLGKKPLTLKGNSGLHTKGKIKRSPGPPFQLVPTERSRCRVLRRLSERRCSPARTLTSASPHPARPACAIGRSEFTSWIPTCAAASFRRRACPSSTLYNNATATAFTAMLPMTISRSFLLMIIHPESP
jgi:hypothetical protein